jgi:S1-C subfamily serine protease
MAGLSGTLTSIVVSMLTSTTDGANVRIGTIVQADSSLQTIGARTIAALNASVDISEKTGYVQYPALLVYCDKLSNALTEKFRQFSGKAHVVVEARYSQDELGNLQTNADVYVDAVCALLDDSRGDWGSGFFYSGGYDVSYEPVVRGGNNFLQRAKVGFNVEVSK